MTYCLVWIVAVAAGNTIDGDRGNDGNDHVRTSVKENGRKRSTRSLTFRLFVVHGAAK